MSVISLQTPLSSQDLTSLRCGDMVELSGVIYTARDAAHARLVEAMQGKDGLPFDLVGQTIYYAGPSPAKPGAVIGSCGPTTSGRMDAFTPALLDAGLVAMIGKGPRSEAVVNAMKEHGAVYFAAVGGAAALTALCIKQAEIVAYEDLGPEAIRRLVVEAYPCVVAIDSRGTSIYETGPASYRVDTPHIPLQSPLI